MDQSQLARLQSRGSRGIAKVAGMPQTCGDGGGDDYGDRHCAHLGIPTWCMTSRSHWRLVLVGWTISSAQVTLAFFDSRVCRALLGDCSRSSYAHPTLRACMRTGYDLWSRGYSLAYGAFPRDARPWLYPSSLALDLCGITILIPTTSRLAAAGLFPRLTRVCCTVFSRWFAVRPVG
jgi:hypothetical protein